MITPKDDYYLGFRLQGNEILGTPQRLDSFVVMRAEKSKTGERLIFRSRENLLSNADLLGKMLDYAGEIAKARNQTFHIARDTYEPKEGDPFLYFVEETGGETPLSDVLAEQKLPERTVLSYISHVLEALGAFHSKGLVYGTIDPRFIFPVDAGGSRRAKLGGLFYVHRDGDIFPVGYNPEFMAPEIPGLESVSEKAKDVYSVGMLAYRMLLSREVYEGLFPNAFLASTDTDKANAWLKYHQDKYQENTPFAELRALDPKIPPSISSVVQKMMNIASEARFADALEARQAFGLAMEEADSWRYRMNKIKEEGVGPGTIPSLKITETRPTMIVGIAALALSLLVTAGGGAYYYQFVYKPRLAREAAYDAALNKAAELNRAETAATNALRGDAEAAVGRLDKDGEPANAFAQAEGVRSELQAQSVANTPEAIDAFTAQIADLGKHYAAVLDLVGIRRGEAEKSLSVFDERLGALSGVVAEGDAAYERLSQALSAYRARFDDGAFDVVISEVPALIQGVDEEILARERAHRSAQEAADAVSRAIETLSGLVPTDSAVLTNYRDGLSGASQAIEDRKSEEARTALEGMQERLQQDIADRKATQEAVAAALQKAKSDLQASRERVAQISDNASLIKALEPMGAKVAAAEDAFAGNRFEDVRASVDDVNADLSALNETISSIAVGAQQKIELLSSRLKELEEALPDGVAPPPELDRSVADARAAKDAGDDSGARQIADAALAEIAQHLAGIQDARKLAEQKRQLANETLILFAASAPRAAELDGERQRFAQGDTAFGNRAYEDAAKLFSETAANATALQRQLKARAQGLSSDADALEARVRQLEAEGGDPELIARLKRRLAAIRGDIEAGALADARGALSQITEGLEAAAGELSVLRDKANQLLSSGQTLLRQFAEIRYVAEATTSKDFESALEQGEKEIDGRRYERAIALLEPAIAAFTGTLNRATGESRSLAEALKVAEATRSSASDAGGASMPRFAEADRQLQSAREQLTRSDLVAAGESLAAAAEGFRSVIGELDQVDKQIAAVTVRIDEALETARRTRAAPEPDLVRFEQSAGAASPSSPQRYEELTNLLGRLEDLNAAVERERPVAEAAKAPVDELSAKMESLDGIGSNSDFQGFSKSYSDANALMNDGAYVAAKAAYAALEAPAMDLYARLTRPPAMSCNVDGMPEGMRQVDSGTFPIGELLQRPRFRKNFGDRLRVSGTQIDVPEQYCIQSRPLMVAEIMPFLREIERNDPLSVRKLPEGLLDTANPAGYLNGISREIVDQYVRWLSQKTGRTARLPTLEELLVADYLAAPESDEPTDSRLVWTSDNCTNFMGVAGTVSRDIDRSRSECRLVISNFHEDVFVRLLLENVDPVEATARTPGEGSAQPSR